MTTLGAPAVAGFSRFHAIVTAKPMNPAAPQPQQPVQVSETLYRQEPTNTYEQWGVRFQTERRKKSTNEGGSAAPKKASKRASDEDGGSGREPTTLYRDREELLFALRDRFKQGSNVNFHGMYEMPDSSMSHKQRIQTVVHEIWKATGYRFTVKDHPQLTNGHKTRFWCSQDEAHRSKSSRAARKSQGSFYKPRVTSTGEVMAKTRYPCRSRLLVSSRDCDKPGIRIITVRMHHHIAHEPYVDSNLTPETTQGMWDTFPWAGQQDPSVAQTAVAPIPNGNIHEAGPSGTHREEEEESSEEDDEQQQHQQQQQQQQQHQQQQQQQQQHQQQQQQQQHHNLTNMFARMPDTAMRQDMPPPPPVPRPPSPMPVVLPPPPPTIPTAVPPIPSAPPSLPPAPPPPPEHFYRNRMQTHIKNIREFCAGLEYQLQFNDYRMLNALEADGASFLRLVEECLRKEGRLITAEPPPPPMASLHDAHANVMTYGDPRLSRHPDANPGINPRALNY